MSGPLLTIDVFLALAELLSYAQVEVHIHVSNYDQSRLLQQRSGLYDDWDQYVHLRLVNWLQPTSGKL